MSVNNNIYLGKGNISFDKNLGAYYQDIAPAIFHFENNSLGNFDKNGIPFVIEKDRECYSAGYVIQYALIQHELILQNNNVIDRKIIMQNCLRWLKNNLAVFHDSLVWRNEKNTQYKLKKGWVSAMNQGQGISLFLRASQLFNETEYVALAEKLFLFFKYDYSAGGATRTDEMGYIWLEEYPSNPASYVLNGFVYALLGILDLYRVTQNKDALKLYEECLKTIEHNIYKYDRFYWSSYDQLKKELVSFYYQKNVHIPLMEILFGLTKKDIFNKLSIKWTKQLNSKFFLCLVQIMYRVQPQLRKLQK